MQTLCLSQTLSLIKPLTACFAEAQPPGTGTVHRGGPSDIEALGKLLLTQSSFELEHCLFPGLFSMISQQSAIAHGPGLLLQRNSTYDISLLQRGQSLSSPGLKKSRWNSLAEILCCLIRAHLHYWEICLIRQKANNPCRRQKKKKKKGKKTQIKHWPHESMTQP